MRENERAELKEKEKKFMLAMESLDNSPDGIFWSDSHQGRFIYVNDQACKKLGYTRKELLNMTIADIDPNYPEEQMSPDGDLLKPITSGSQTHIQTLHRHRDGHLIPVDIAFSLIKFEDHLYVSSTVRDITDRISAEKQLQEAYGRLSVLYEIYRVTTKELDTNILIKETCNILQKTLNFDALIFNLFDESIQEIVLNFAVGLPDDILKFINTHAVKRDIGAIGKAMFSKETIYVKYKEQSEHNLIMLLLREGFTDAIAIPILVDNKCIGGISLMNKFDRQIDVNDQELLKAICNQLSIILHNTKLFDSLHKANKELGEIASTDQLTNIWNRRHFLNEIQIEIKRARRYKQTMFLLLFDIDHFKNINDRFGHQVGDQVLVEFAKILCANIRDFDLLARWGGEEFLILAPHLSAIDAVGFAERLRIIIANHSFHIAGSITVSIGVAEFNQSENLDLWIKKADDALYRVKQLGRNRVELSV